MGHDSMPVATLVSRRKPTIYCFSWKLFRNLRVAMGQYRHRLKSLTLLSILCHAVHCWQRPLDAQAGRGTREARFPPASLVGYGNRPVLPPGHAER
uniref:Uncharacterized protein n=1 Tax=Toxoplasma gondii TgCATBr9 TaxID=943120 RepID=A0A2T6IYP6_TOXGO|nr:hypothetical protein TGBR9_357040 [Toxoplasma gondii TgCATBr9]